MHSEIKDKININRNTYCSVYAVVLCSIYYIYY